MSDIDRLTIDQLIRDHRLLRSKIRLLESALGMGEQAWFTVREVSVTLWQELQAHRQREEEAFLTCHVAWGAGRRASVKVDRAAEQDALRIVKQIFMGQPHACAALRPNVAKVMARLDRQMEQQEASIFPLLKHLLTLRDPAPRTAPPVQAALADGVESQATSRRPCASASS